MAYVDKTWFEEVYTREDGFIEWLTILPLVVVIGFFLTRIRMPFSPRFSISSLLIVSLSFFVMGEEISWGQRIFQRESSDFFQQHNAQGETNLHNLVVRGVKINKVIFSQVLTVMIAFYLLVFPTLYRKSETIRTLVNRWSVPVPRLYQVVSMVLLFAAMSLCPSGKRAELLEMGATTLFSLMVLYPYNPLKSAHKAEEYPAPTAHSSTRTEAKVVSD
ncbi:hypothetical protein ACD591_06210 [Rufibacter glacialis]|uniref:Uncharacterized protein n=1 Tax=Rufibacter glacialis TaxID=1259555 RepID=A0A5M8QFQ1_9BACT|nr:hypothetical protein [Rufibacter glacialis]KAA6433252.1 hypothetical protein FOE74_12260 [Rufibacter glacialis]